ncbi:MAG: NAD(P)-binding domain-containing protein [Actinomycetota bacterium]|nr:NAD(P)-binding domain-containing protein [Actinomycetota bacterium]
MKYAVLGTGVVGRALGSKLVALGNETMMGSRKAGSPNARSWADEAGPLASEGTFADAAAFGEIVINATSGVGSLEALGMAGADNLRGKTLIDVANPLDFSHGMPPTLSVCNDDSLGEQIQRAFPDARVVKSLHTMNCDVMVDPSIIPGSHTVFICGNDAEAKAQVVGMLSSFGWPAADIMDLGDLAGARGTEMYLPLWLRLWAATGTGHVNIKVAT